jgi:hypothetical protein
MKDQARLKALNSIVEDAANISLTLSKQQAGFKVAIPTPGAPFSAQTMEDALQDHRTEEAPNGRQSNVLEGQAISAVIFPVVTKTETSKSSAYSSVVVISRAHVLV